MDEKSLNETVNIAIAERITPIYNTFTLVFAAIFCYFCVMEPTQCYARETQAWSTPYQNTEDVTYQFRVLNITGLAILLISVIVYHSETKSLGSMNRVVVATKLAFLVWFFSL